MSRFIETNSDGTITEEIENMKLCKWLINEVCCNDKCDCLADYPYPRSICELEEDGKNYSCNCFEKEDGVINE
jgi:hypothetical protein